MRPLPPLPAIRVRVARDRTEGALATGGFLNVTRVDLVLTYPNGDESPPFQYDIGTRNALDSAVIAAFYDDEHGERHVYLRSAVRPPCALVGLPREQVGGLWELPAGLIEPGEAPAAAAARELHEELGFVASEAAMRELGGWTFPVPGMIGERNFFFCAEVDPASRALPTEDGLALERFAAIVALPARDVLEHCRAGAIRDAKTELAMRRLAEIPARAKGSP